MKRAAWMLAPTRRWTPAVALVVLACAALPASASADADTAECVGLSGCVSVTSAPWVRVPAQRTGVPAPTFWRVTCPDGRVPAGSDHLQGPGDDPYTTRLLLPGGGLTGGPTAIFAAFSQGDAGAFKPLVGCVAFDQNATAAGLTRGARVRVRARRLRPNRTYRHAHGCARGERLVGGGHGVGFAKSRAPSTAEVRQVRTRVRIARGRVVVETRTGALAGDDERLILQIHAHCVRRP